MRNKNSPGALAGAAEAGIEWFDRPEDTTLQDGMSLSGAMAEPQSPDAPAIDLEAEIARLAGLSKIAYEKARRPAADKFGMRVSVIDELIAEKRGDGKDRDGGAQGR